MEVNIMLIQITKNTEPLFSAIDNKIQKLRVKHLQSKIPYSLGQESISTKIERKFYVSLITKSLRLSSLRM